MYTFTITTAGYNIEIETDTEYLYRMCVSYVVQAKPDFNVRILQSDIDSKNNNYGLSGKTDYRLNEDIVFGTLLHQIADELIERDVLLIHGAAVSLDDRAYLFTGKSGTGKTTHVCKWMQHRPDLTVVNGDKPFIRVEKTPLVCGSPWAGKEGFSSNIMKPLNSIIILERNENNVIHHISFGEAFPILLNSVFLSNNPDKKTKAIKLLLSLGDKILFYRYQVNNLKEDCFEVIYREIHGRDKI